MDWHFWTSFAVHMSLSHLRVVLSPDTTFTIAPPGNVNSLWHQKYDLSLEDVGFNITLRQHSTAYQQACVTCSPHFSKWGTRLASEKPVRWLTSDGNDVSSMLCHELLMKCVCCMLDTLSPTIYYFWLDSKNSHGLWSRLMTWNKQIHFTFS